MEAQLKSDAARILEEWKNTYYLPHIGTRGTRISSHPPPLNPEILPCNHCNHFQTKQSSSGRDLPQKGILFLWPFTFKSCTRACACLAKGQSHSWKQVEREETTWHAQRSAGFAGHTSYRSSPASGAPVTTLFTVHVMAEPVSCCLSQTHTHHRILSWEECQHQGLP